MQGKLGIKGVLLINLGTPDAPERGAVYRYLKEFLLDRRVIDIPAVPRNLLVRGIIAPFRSGKSAEGYKKLWTAEGSPLKVFGYKLLEGIKTRLGEDYHVELAMRYQQPSIASAVEKLLRANVSEIIVMPLYPHYASATTGSIYEEVMRVLSKEWTIPALRFINSFPDHPEMIKLYADNARKFDLASYDHVLFSYHGVPLRQLTKGDKSGAHCQVKADCCSSICPENQFCYSAQTYATTRALVKELGLQEGQYTHCFQSRLGKTPWTQPYTSVVLQELAAKGKKNMLVFSPSFVSDCLETTIEIGMEYAEEWHELGGNQLQLVESLNDNPIWMDLVTKLITKSSAFNI